MFDKTYFAAASLVLSAIMLTGYCGGNSGNAATGAAPGISDVGGGTPAVPVVTGGTPEVPVIKHPGAGLTLSDLQTVKANVDQGKEPWKSAFNQLANSPTSRLSYAGRGGPFVKVSRAPDENLFAWRTDMVAISELSEMWYFTRDERYAVNARKLLLGWATTQTEFSGRESMLDLGDYAFQFVGGAEILRSTYPGWTEADTATVKKYFKNVLMPAANPYGENSFGAANKGALSLVALGLMAIYNDDNETLDKVVYQTRTLAHIGLRNSNDIGMLGDSLRDQGHAYGQLASLTMLAEALWTQGIDIYSDFDNRLLAAGEYFARVNELIPTTALPFGTTDRYYTSDITNRGWDGANGGSVALTQLYSAYVLRKGLQAPFIAQRRLWMPVGGTSFMFLKDSDTSKATPPPPLPIPSTTSITSGFSSADIGGAAPAGTATYANGKWTVQGAGNDIFWGTQDASHFTYKAITGNSAIIAKVESVENTHPAAVAGVMMRTSLEQGAPRAWMAVASNGQAKQNMQKLAVYGGSNYGTKAMAIASSTASYWVKLERIGNIITGYVSPDGTNWAATDVGRIDGPVPDTIYVGLLVASVANGTLNSSTFSNVQITGGDGGAPSVIPEAPAMLLASPGDGAVPLRWQASFGATGYTVNRSKFSGGPSETIASGITGSSYTDKSVSNGTTYYYTVTATNSAGTSGSSQADSATPFHPMVNVATGGIATDSGNTSGAMRAFDQNTGSGWFYKGTTGWLQYDLGHTERVQSYTVSSTNGLVLRDPKDWQFQGSYDGSTWTTLDTQSNQGFGRRLELKTYTIPNPNFYRYYRLNVTANTGDVDFTDLGEFGLLVSKPR
ncbi:alginate lyase family protein [Paenarthrobacter nitroguajacolicus]|uniref:alginate lyase family protein n=1 Tax=Paenarthrobacter nitroguajacolicus TaxID=211146 RepID=UPI0028625791|nr:alginate lyase family protein [Paenarthrobacter nitroguajacolicus]MDR6639526.1 hypothetical protein [Paenarthrobacter nitroguajacolicus]